MEITVKEIASLVGGAIVGNPEIKINRPSRIDETGGLGSISFYGNPKYETFVYTTEASALLVPKGFEPKTPIQATLIKVDDVYAAIATLLESFGQKASQPASISEQAKIHASAQIGKEVSIGAFSSVGAKSCIGAAVNKGMYKLLITIRFLIICTFFAKTRVSFSYSYKLLFKNGKLESFW